MVKQRRTIYVLTPSSTSGIHDVRDTICVLITCVTTGKRNDAVPVIIISVMDEDAIRDVIVL